MGCAACGSQARLHARRTVGVRDLPIGGRPVVPGLAQAGVALCRAGLCGPDLDRADGPGLDSGGAHRTGPGRGVPAGRHRRPRGRRRRPGSGVGWSTVMRAVVEHGTPLVDDPARLDGVAALGLDETSFLKAIRRAATRYVTGLVDMEGGRRWRWWPTAPGPRWVAGCMPGRATGWLHCGVAWQTHRTARLRGRSPRLVA
jgi:hypothetical protein